MAVDRYQFKNFPYSSHRWLLSRVGKQPVRILEAGAWNGFLGQELVRRGHTVVGIEREPAMAHEARSVYGQFVEADLDELPTIPGPPYHILLCGDVLEHTREPLRVLQHLAATLLPGGKVLATVPNVAFLSVRLSLLFGSFTYKPRGILDQSHLRFFTKKSFCRLLDEAKLEVVHLAGLPPPLPLVWAGFLSWPWRGFFLLAAFLAKIWPSLFAYQLAVEARKSL